MKIACRPRVRDSVARIEDQSLARVTPDLNFVLAVEAPAETEDDQIALATVEADLPEFLMGLFPEALLCLKMLQRFYLLFSCLADPSQAHVLGGCHTRLASFAAGHLGKKFGFVAFASVVELRSRPEIAAYLHWKATEAASLASAPPPGTGEEGALFLRAKDGGELVSRAPPSEFGMFAELLDTLA